MLVNSKQKLRYHQSDVIELSDWQKPRTYFPETVHRVQTAVELILSPDTVSLSVTPELSCYTPTVFTLEVAWGAALHSSTYTTMSQHILVIVDTAMI